MLLGKPGATRNLIVQREFYDRWKLSWFQIKEKMEFQFFTEFSIAAKADSVQHGKSSSSAMASSAT